MYRIKTKFKNSIGEVKTKTSYANTKWENGIVMESHYDYIEWEEGIIIKQEVEKGYFTPVKKIYNYKLKNGGGH